MATQRDIGEGSFVAFLKAAMAAAHIPNENQLADRAGLDSSVVNRWVKKGNQPSLDALRAIAPVLHVEPWVLFVRAGHVRLDELPGMEGAELPPVGNHTLEDELMHDPRIPKAKREQALRVIQTFFEEGPDSGTDVRTEHTA